jgi:serine/threonine protein kinase
VENNSPDSPQIPLTDEQEFNQRHTLYIQMQLCSFDNLSDFLANPEARRGCLSQGIDIALALRLFLQIARAVQYVHAQKMIHRDLKPTNCFVDDNGQIKVGDFGLSRESGDHDGTNIIETQRARDEDQTAGVGTRLYASPEQSAGTSYDSSTDVYSLGIILFELCYPMYTGMERNICISRLRDKHEFPSDWDAIVTSSFPTLRELLLSMLSLNPKERPKATSVVNHIQEVLGELTIISITDKETSSENLILLRVEADSDPDTLGNTMGQIRQAAHPGTVDIIQYGLAQSKDSHIIMEFALRSSAEVEAGLLVSRLKERPRIRTARQVSVSK